MKVYKYVRQITVDISRALYYQALLRYVCEIKFILTGLGSTEPSAFTQFNY